MAISASDTDNLLKIIFKLSSVKSTKLTSMKYKEGGYINIINLEFERMMLLAH